MNLGDAMASAMNKQVGRGNLPDIVKENSNYVFRKERQCNIRTKRDRIQKWCDGLPKGKEFTMRDVGKIFDISPGKARGVFRSIEGVDMIRLESGRSTGVWVKR